MGKPGYIIKNKLYTLERCINTDPLTYYFYCHDNDINLTLTFDAFVKTLEYGYIKEVPCFIKERLRRRLISG